MNILRSLILGIWNKIHFCLLESAVFYLSKEYTIITVLVLWFDKKIVIFTYKIDFFLVVPFSRNTPKLKIHKGQNKNCNTKSRNVGHRSIVDRSFAYGAKGPRFKTQWRKKKFISVIVYLYVLLKGS